MLILRFLLNEGGEMVMEAAGRVLGMRDIPIPSTFILVYLVALAVLFWKAANGRSKRRLKVRTRALTGGEKEPIDRTRALARGEKKPIVSTRVLAGGGKKSVVSVVEQTDNVTETLAGTKARRESVSLVSLVVCVLVFLLTFTALYLQWNAVHATIMEGFQGRYLIPLMFPGFLVLAQMRKHEKPAFNIWNQCCVLMVNFCCCTCVLFSKI
jgi:hypothetical protein